MEKEKLKMRLVNALQKSHYDLPTLAKQLGISQKQLNNYVNGKTLPPIVVFANMCKILELDPNEIIKKKDD
ncbi:MAG: helix-turn-helix domain-containing protein [Clostridia bacterium]|nr:helix-turn-helix domain-containing protein [Clostridia bacterium]